LNLDDMNTRLIVVNLKANLSQEQHTYLPPQVQKIVKEHEIRGVLDVNITGSVPIKDYKKGDLQANLSLAQANFSAGEYRMPIQTLNINARLADGKLMLSELALTALKGELKLAGSVALNHPMDTDLQLNVTDMMLQELMRASSPSHPPTLAGRLNVDIQATVPLRAVIAQANPSTQPVTSDLAAVALPGKWGSGRIDLDQARLVNLPVFGHLNQALAKGESIISPAQEKFDEKANLLFDFSGNGARFSQINYVGPVLAVRGTGTITLDQKLDLTLNGGPVEKVQAILGKQIGPTIGKLTDQLVAYRVTGTLKEPKVSLEVAGGATELAGDAAKAVKQGAGEAAKTVEKAGEAIIGIFEKKK
jgi:hypothetical protein